MIGLEEKKILIAGAASGIGKAIAQRLSREKAQLFLGDIDTDGVKSVAIETKARYGWFDLANSNSIEQLVKNAVSTLGGLDGIINVAAALDKETMEKDLDIINMDDSLWQHVLTANLTGYALLLKHAVPHLLKNNGGAIVNISSITVHMGGADEPAYVASKAGINALTRHVATVWGKQNIRANAIAPGVIAHERMRQLTPQKILDDRLKEIRLGRLGTAEDVASLAAFLVSDDAEWVTGQVWAVDGGHTLRE